MISTLSHHSISISIVNFSFDPKHDDVILERSHITLTDVIFYLGYHHSHSSLSGHEVAEAEHGSSSSSSSDEGEVPYIDEGGDDDHDGGGYGGDDGGGDDGGDYGGGEE